MSDNYKKAQKILHWVLAVLILFWLFVSGELAADSEGAEQAFILSFHSGGAIIILALTLYRYGLRRRNPVAPLQQLQPWEKTWSVRLHLTLYVLVGLMVLSGISQAIFFTQDVRVFGLIDITVSNNETARELFHEAHELIALLFKICIALHILAALKHQFINRDSLIRRML